MAASSLPAEAGTAYLVGDPLTQATVKTAEWIDRASFQVEKVKMLQVRHPATPGGSSGAPITLIGVLRAPNLAKSWMLRANAASYSCSFSNFADIAPKDAKDTGLETPISVEATTLEGANYSIKVGKLAGENHYVSFSASGPGPTPRTRNASRFSPSTCC